MTPDGWKRIFSALTYENAVALRVSLETGLRVGDVLALRPDALQGDTLTVTASKTGKEGTYRLTATTANRLRHCVGRWWMFPGRDPTKHRTRQAVYKDLRTACERLHVPGHISPHSARKTFAVGVYRAQGLRAVKRALQHDSDITSMLYALSDKIAERESGLRELSAGGDIVEQIAERVVQKLKGSE